MQVAISGGTPSEMARLTALSVGDYFYLLECYILDQEQKANQIKANEQNII